MDLNFEYVDENGKHVPGEILYQTKIDGKFYVICNLSYGPDNNDIVAFKVIEDGEGQKFVQLDESDNVEALKAQIAEMLKGAE